MKQTRHQRRMEDRFRRQVDRQRPRTLVKAVEPYVEPPKRRADVYCSCGTGDDCALCRGYEVRRDPETGQQVVWWWY